MGRYSGQYHIGSASPGFANNVRRMLQVRQAKHYTHGHKSGKISKARMYRVGMPVVGDGDWNSRVFKRRTADADLMNTAISVLTDWSGSMGGMKSVHAAKAAGLLNEAFSRVLHIPLELLAFTSNGSTPVMGIIKSFERNASADQIADRFEAFLRYMSGNNDADALQWAYQRILRRKEQRKILLVMSDGCPADGIGDPSYALKEVVNQINRERRVELYGIGIMDRNVQRYYPKWHVIDHAEGIEAGLITVLGKALT